MFVWVNAGATSDNALVAALSSSPSAYIIPSRATSAVLRSRLNDATTADSSTAVSSPVGFSTVSRTASTGYSQYRDTILIGSATATSTGVPAQPWAIGRGPSTYNGNRVAAAGYGSGLNATETALLYTRLRDYLSAIGGI